MNKNADRSRCFAAMKFALGLTAAACASGNGAGSSEATSDTGTVDLALTAGPVTLNSVRYIITNDRTGFSKSGYFDVTNSTQLVATIGGIPAGTGYYISLDAVAQGDPNSTCRGWAIANVTAGSTTTTSIVLSCTIPRTTGSVKIDGSVNICPTLTAMSVEPAQTTVGHSVSLTGLGDDVDDGPGSLTYHWVSTVGTIAEPNSATTTWTCTGAGSNRLTLFISDGDANCWAEHSESITCAEGDASGGGAGAGGSSGTGGAGGSAGSAEPGDDPSTPGDDRAGYVLCTDTLTCKPGFLCCSSTQSCEASLDTCPDARGSKTCDGPEDCANGLVCRVYKATECQPPLEGDHYGHRCHTDADCAGSTNYCSSTGSCSTR